MSFDSSFFIGVVLISMVIYYLPVLRRYQVLTLIAASCVFYGFSSLKLLLLLLAVITFNAFVSYKTNFCGEKARLFWITLGVSLNLMFLAFFKYRLQIYSGIFSEFKTPGSLGDFLLILPLPLGISFYTFESISLLVDVFRAKQNHTRTITIERNFAKHWVSTAAFVLFFPKLISGPIVRARDFWPQVSYKSFRAIPWDDVIRLLILGYFLKTVVANNLNQTTFWIAAPYFKEYSSVTLITLLFGYSVQIFADFAGYSLIAVAVALMFGYKLPNNFNYPYISKSVTEFWRRWHISLSSWLREYLYFPLGGSRKGKGRTYINLIIVMALGGLWHGATWGFGVWGLWHGVALAVERVWTHLKNLIFRPDIETAQSQVSAAAEQPSGLTKKVTTAAMVVFYDFIRMLAVFCFVSVGWLVFKLSNFGEVIQYVVSIFNNTQIPGIDKPILFSVAMYSMPVILYHLFYLASEAWNISLKRYQGMIYGTLLFLIAVNGGDSNAFIYFQF